MFPQVSLQILCIVILALGICFRVVNLDGKVFWGDETYSASRIAGYSGEEIIREIYSGEEISVAQLQHYQNPDSERSLADSLNVMATEAPHHPPLYYIIARFWEQWFGSSIVVKRSVPVLISLLGFPCLYWLCLELFGSSLTAWIAVALYAVSPIHVLYAQEVREYSLWTVTVLLSGAALLRAMRVKTVVSWGVYALTVALALYSHLFSAPILIGQGIYFLVIQGWRSLKSLVAYLLAGTTGILLFSPWIAVFIENERQASQGWAWVIKKLPSLALFQNWARNLVYGFFDIPLGYEYPFDFRFSYTEPRAYLVLPIVALVGYAIYFLCRHTPKNVWLFVLLLMGFTSLPLVLPDLVSGGVRSTIVRYQLPTYVGIQLAIAYLLATKLSKLSGNIGQMRLWRWTTVALLSCGVISCVIIAQASTWWTKYSDYYNNQVAQIVNQSPAPLVLSDSSHNRILSLSHLLKPQAQFQLVERQKDISVYPEAVLPEISGQFSDVFVVESIPSPSLLRPSLEAHKGYTFELLYRGKIGFKNRETLVWRRVD